MTSRRIDDIRASLSRMRGDPSRVLAGMAHVEATAANAWIDAPAGGTLAWTLEGPNEVRGELVATGSPQVLALHESPGIRLQPDTPYTLKLAGADPVHFRTDFATDDPQARYAIGFGSCHQPFTADGRLDERSLAALRGFGAAAEAASVRRTLLLGDQMYTDQPFALSLFDKKVLRALSDGAISDADRATPEQLFDWFTERYRSYWNVPEWRTMMAAAPTYMIWDDHEVWDNFGTGRKDRSEGRRPSFEAAHAAYRRYQRLGRPEQSTTPDFSFRYGRVAVLVADLRSHRGYLDNGEYRVFSEAQRTWLPEALEQLADAPVLILGLSVPFLTFPPSVIDWVGSILPDGNNIQDRWAFGECRKERAWLLECVTAHADRHPHQKIVLVSGDIHIGMATEFVRGEGRAPLLQFVSSAISNHEGRSLKGIMAFGSRVFGTVPHRQLFTRRRLLQGVDGHGTNPFVGQNMGLIEVEHRGDDTRLRLSLVSGDDDGRPTYPFRTDFF